MTRAPIPIWLDCDPGTDDAFAILLLAFHPQFNLIGISTVHGNAPLNATTHNTVGLLDVLKLNHIPVYAGEVRPLVKEPFFGLYAHGKTGLGGAELPENPSVVVKNDKSYMEAIKEAVETHANEICVIATGTFTNMSNLFAKYPDLKHKIKYLPIMGAGFGVGNVTPYAEFNVYVDPKAANNLFHDEDLMDKLIVNGLNITHTAIADETIRQKLFGKPHKNLVRPMFESIMMFYFKQLYSENGWAGPPLHDPLAVFTLLPVLYGAQAYKFEWFRRRVTAVEGGENDGETVFVDGSKFEDDGSEEHGSIIAKSVDIDMFYEYVGVALDNAEEHVQKRS
ncbi:Uridine nucleosidase 1 [Yamadazyma tenuis]|uniref:Nucleoside hydrolase n=1 Tax=Candida tenuis (strain ATCC 10573 / BCRC 21748 / CBS 615 / JCM 9827 / NBRC 10315 / NRRL Y-1498 / VKM Y-70) TaxID=590646 RepID=G3BD63_CANTC|nr:nucleoside hydrolase [Yamadazyma tenuis ATCC 10573]XP_006690285.1 uncharacterized protein CANTEDRAFT_116309 [Yamadazyma tenuis ATCC 10573]EGV61070.1 nucleoside hydrolase [Yamadazyma tenuis ATCC 10573]EGV61071.1 hypothetical protein CANTEDRAFT_116309 [Yamadazyma tenuis ATCC 10573]WEJ94509.1 Uridine nucleosidase 1 [Yamadazyma tenuis]